MAINIQLRRGTASQWTAANPTLMEGELGVETDTAKYKLGNGSTAWNSLSYGGLVSSVTLANLPANPVTGYALIYDGSTLAWGQAGVSADDDQAVLSGQVFGRG